MRQGELAAESAGNISKLGYDFCNAYRPCCRHPQNKPSSCSGAGVTAWYTPLSAQEQAAIAPSRKEWLEDLDWLSCA